MSKIKLPYHKGHLIAEIDDKNLVAVLEPKTAGNNQNQTQEDIVENALNNYIGGKPLEELVKGKKNMIIITSDHTRPVPSKITLPILLKRIRMSNPSIDIKILISTGFHRPTTKEEMIDKFGEDVVNNEKFINHNAHNAHDQVNVGVLPSGGDLWLNRIAMETELLIAEGFIEPHFFAGFSGGRKSILPGVAGADTIMWNHNSEFIANPNARTGILVGNPLHKDMLHAVKVSKLAFILNVIIDSDKKVIHAVSGDPIEAHARGCEFLAEHSGLEKKTGDIVISTNGGYPLDQNIYQSVKGMTAAESCCNENAIIIMVSACNDGHGGESFYKNMKEGKSPQEVLEKVLSVPKNKTMPDQWEFQILSRILSKHQVIMVTDCDEKIITDMHMKYAKTFDEAILEAYKIKGKDSKVVVIPDGVSVIIK